jgi:hypothetical protein
MKRKQTPEGALQRLVMDWMAAKHIFAIRCNSGVLVNPAGRPVTFGIPGCADILAFPIRRCPDGDHGMWKIPTPLWIELKAPNGRQSDLQKSFQAKVEAEGHRYFLIKSLDELEAQL